MVELLAGIFIGLIIGIPIGIGLTLLFGAFAHRQEMAEATSLNLEDNPRLIAALAEQMVERLRLE